MSPNTNISKIKPSRKQISYSLYNIFLDFVSLLIIIAILLLVIHPEKYMQSIINGLNLFFCAVLPSLLPFLFLTKILSSIGATAKISKIFLPLTKKVFKVNSCAGFIMLSSYLCGYPIGAKLVGDFVKNGTLTEREALRIIPLVTTSGPIFVIGAVGAGMLGNTRLGLYIFLVHIISSLLTGYIFSLFGRKKAQETHNKTTIISKPFSLEETTINTFTSVLMVAVYVSVFYMFIDMAYNLNILSFLSKIIDKFLVNFNLIENPSTAISSGIIEMTRGVKELSFLNCPQIKLIVASSLISFSGISIILQSLAFLTPTKINPVYFVFIKLVQTLITVVTSILFCLIFF